MRNQHITSLYKQQRPQHSHCLILKMRVNVNTTTFCCATGALYVPIGCSHQFMRYWQPLGEETSATRSLPHPENERQLGICSFISGICCNQ
jgi:hypothetical protein